MPDLLQSDTTVINLNDSSWKKLGSGSYNTAYQRGDTVIKVQHNSAETDTPKRSIRLWNLLNAGIQPPASIIEVEMGYANQRCLAWSCPFIEGNEATDKQKSEKLIDIFNKTQRILIDASSKKNIIYDSKKKKVICIDVGLLFDIYAEDAPPKLYETASLNWRSNYAQHAARTLKNPAHLEECPLTIKTVKALLFLRSCRRDLINADFLKQDNRIERYAKAYDCLCNDSNTVLPPSGFVCAMNNSYNYSGAIQNTLNDIYEHNKPKSTDECLRRTKINCLKLLVTYIDKVLVFKRLDLFAHFILKKV